MLYFEQLFWNYAARAPTTTRTKRYTVGTRTEKKLEYTRKGRIAKRPLSLTDNNKVWHVP